MKRKIIKACCGVALASVFAVSLASCKKTYTISFDTNDGSSIENVTFGEGNKLDSIATPTKDGYVFGGWYSDPDFTKKFDLSKDLPNNDFTLYAKWNVKLEFNSTGGSKVEAVIGDPLKPFVMPSEPVREGFVFKGWYKDEALTQPQTIVMPAKNATCYAKWLVAENSSALTLGEFKVNDPSHYVVEGNKFTATKEKGDYSFFASNIDFNVNSYGGVKLEVTGTKGVNILVKLEGGGADATEKQYKMTGDRQTIVMPVQTNNLTSTGGQRLLVFLNPGVVGCSETPEFVEIHKAQIVKTVDEDKANRESGLFFVTNGAGSINPIFGQIGTSITMPKNPEKPFATFIGWYTDKELTNKFEETVFPNQTQVLYAKWESEIKNVDMLQDTFVENDQDTYKFTKGEDGSLVIDKIVDRSWVFAKSTLKGSDIKGLGYLKIEVKGTKGHRVLFKVNNQGGTCEKWIDLTGEKQYVVLDFSTAVINDNEPALLMFLHPEADLKSQVTISELTFTNKFEQTSLLDKVVANNDTEIKVNKVENNLEVEKISAAEWTFIKNDEFKVSNVGDYKKLVINVKGNQGEKLKIKLGDFNQFEFDYDLTGEVQTIVIDLPEFPTNLNGNNLLTIFVNPGSTNLSKTIVFSQISLLY